MSTFTLFLALLAAHALCDYPLQGDFLARAKNHRSPLPGVPWYQALTAHALIHAAAVAILTQSWILGALEFAAHALTDYGKSEGWYGYNTDQIWHMTAKSVWVSLFILNPWCLFHV